MALNKKQFIVAKQVSQGYREYKNGDGYDNPMNCFVFVES